MSALEPVINGLENLDAVMRSYSQEEQQSIGYIKVKQGESVIDRLQFGVDALTPYLEEDDGNELTFWALWLAARKWIVTVALRNAVAEKEKSNTFVVCAFATKGTKRLFARQLVVRFPPSRVTGAVSSHEAVPSLPQPSMEATAFSDVTKFYRSLGEQYTHLGHLAAGTGGNIQLLMERVAERQEREIEGLRGTIADLQNRLESAQREARESDRETQTNVVELAKLHVTREAVSQVGGLVQGLMQMKLATAIPPRLQLVMQKLSGSPELIEALCSEEVLKLLDNPQMLTLVATQLRQIASLPAESAEGTAVTSVA